MDEEELLKRKLMEQRAMQQMAEQQQSMQQAAMQEMMEKQVKEALNKMLDEKARQRLGNIKMIKPQLAQQLEMYLYQLYQSGQLKKVTDEQMIQILKKITEKPDFKIKRV